MNYIYCYLFCLYKKKPTDYCGLSISVIYNSIVTVAVNILVCGTVDNSDRNHKKNTSTENDSTGKNMMSNFYKNTTELLCMVHYRRYSNINHSA